VLNRTLFPYRQTDQDEYLRAPARTQEGLVFERISYLILPVRQLSSEPFGRHRTGPIRYVRAAGQAAGPISNRNDIRKPSGTPTGMRRTMRRIDDISKWRVRRQLIGKETEGYVRSSRV